MFDLDHLRQLRIFDFAVFDLVTAYIGVLIITPLLNRLAKRLHLNLTTKHWLWLTLPASVVIHLLFRTNTLLVREVLDPFGYYLVKAILVVMTFMGLKDIGKKA